MINFFSILTLAYFSLEKIYDILYKATLKYYIYECAVRVYSNRNFIIP